MAPGSFTLYRFSCTSVQKWKSLWSKHVECVKEGPRYTYSECEWGSVLHILRSEYYSVWFNFKFKVYKSENHFGPSELRVLMGVSATHTQTRILFSMVQVQIQSINFTLLYNHLSSFSLFKTDYLGKKTLLLGWCGSLLLGLLNSNPPHTSLTIRLHVRITKKSMNILLRLGLHQVFVHYTGSPE